MNKNQNKIVMVLLILTSTFFNANATEVFKSKAAGGGVNEFKQYSMCRNNLNNGFLYAGTTKNAFGDDGIHIIKTDNALNTVWSFSYMEVPQHSLNATKIINNNTGNGYWISGYWGDGGGFYPFVMQIDELGNVTMHNMGNTKGVFLDVAPTSDGGCIAVGFLSDNIHEGVSTGRRGFVAKFSAILAVNWTNIFHTNSRTSRDINFFECAENVTVINNIRTGNNDYYFITGSVSDTLVKSATQNVPNLFYLYVNNTGGLIYKSTSLRLGNALDAVYDATDHSIYYIGKWDVKNTDQQGVIGKIDVGTGNVIYQKLFEGGFTGFPYPHFVVPYKIELNDDKLMVFGHIRAYVMSSPPTVTSDNIMIPFHAVLNKIDASQVSFTINHTNINRTDGYPSLDPGFLNAWDNIVSAVYTAHFPSIYVPEMGLKYYDINGNLQWGMISYNDQSGGPIEYDLQLITSEGTGECYPADRNLVYYDKKDITVETHYLPILYDTHTMFIQKTMVTCNDESCRP